MFNQKKIGVMKKVLFISMVMAGTLKINRMANAFMMDPTVTLIDAVSQGEKTKIKKEELPEPVQRKLSSDAYKGWAVVNSYKLAGEEYQVELKKGDTTQVLKFDKDGNVK